VSESKSKISSRCENILNQVHAVIEGIYPKQASLTNRPTDGLNSSMFSNHEKSKNLGMDGCVEIWHSKKIS
jgi:hypothetical protein